MISYQAGSITNELEMAKIDKTLAENIVKHAQTELDALIVFVPKKNRTIQFCVVYREFNASTYRNSYPIPGLGECIDSLSKATVFSTLDASSGKCQIKVDDVDKDKTAFTSNYGLYWFVRMPIRLGIAFGTFQRTMKGDLV